MWRTILISFWLAGCGGVAFNTTVANSAEVRWAMMDSFRPGVTTETGFVAQWGLPTQKVREGAETRFIYRDMRNPAGFHPVPQFGSSGNYVVAVFQFGIARYAYSSDTEGCRATFPPRPPGPGFDNPSTVHAVNCGLTPATGAAVVPDGMGRASASDGPGGPDAGKL